MTGLSLSLVILSEAKNLLVLVLAVSNPLDRRKLAIPDYFFLQLKALLILF
tara:strand:+ start:209 stop:361 length:153 start_codon:yes stop_codon:yes gene_type:complete